MNRDAVDQNVFQQLLDRRYFCHGDCGRESTVAPENLRIFRHPQILEGWGFVCESCIERLGVRSPYQDAARLSDILKTLYTYNGARDSDAAPLTVRSIALAEMGYFHPRPPAEGKSDEVIISFYGDSDLGLIHIATLNGDAIARGQGDDITATVRIIQRAHPTALFRIDTTKMNDKR